jgi:P-type Cu+ transporter
MYAQTQTFAQALCHHCGTVCPERVQEIDGMAFCCSGCHTVFEVLRDNGLQQYYQLAEKPGTRLSEQNQRPGRFSYLDEEQIQRRLFDYDDGQIARLDLHMPQIHCASCVWLLENLHRLETGVRRAEVNFVRRHVYIEIDRQHLTLRHLIERLSSLGYEPRINLDSGDGATEKNGGHSELVRLAVAGFCFGNAMLFSFPEYFAGPGELEGRWSTLFTAINIVLALPILLYSANPFLSGAYHSLKHREITLDVPISLGILALFGRSAFEIIGGYGSGYVDSLAGLVFLLLLGRSFQRRSFAALAFDRDYRSYFPLAATVIDATGERSVPLAQLAPGDRLRLRHGELVPADGRLLSPQCRLDCSYVTGEAEPQEISRGETLLAGGRLVGPAAEMVVEQEVSHSYLTRLWNHQVFRPNDKQSNDKQNNKNRDLQSLADRFSRHFTLGVVLLAAAAAIYWLPSDTATAVDAFTAVLIVACPCALALATPFTLGTALNLLASTGLYLRDAALIEELGRIDAVVFDKTGTLSTSRRAAVRFEGVPLSATQHRLVAAALSQSAHPLSRRLAGTTPVPAAPVETYQETEGHGLHCRVEGHEVVVGSRAWLESHGIPDTADTADTAGSAVYVGLDGTYRGAYRLGGEYRADLGQLLGTLRRDAQLYLLSGDNDGERQHLSTFFDANKMHFSQTPEAKLNFVDHLEKDRRVLMVGDGLNDAGALKRSSVGLALSEDTATFSPACDGILDAPSLDRLPAILRLSRACRHIIAASFALSLAYNAVGLSFAVSGQLSPLLSAVLMPLSSISVVAFAAFATRLTAYRVGIRP